MTPPAQSYRVRIHYREPTYEVRTGGARAPYSWTYTLLAANEQAAIDGAMAEFSHIARLSNAGWVRKVVKVEVEVALE